MTTHYDNIAGDEVLLATTCPADSVRIGGGYNINEANTICTRGSFPTDSKSWTANFYSCGNESSSSTGSTTGSSDPVTFAECSYCDGKVSEMTLKHRGTTTALVKVIQKNGSVVFSGSVAPNEEFSFVGTDKKDTLGTRIFIYADGELVGDLHTSCSVPIGPGTTIGDFLVTDGASRNGGQLCPMEGYEDDGGDTGTSCPDSVGSASVYAICLTGAGSGTDIDVDNRGIDNGAGVCGTAGTSF
jgi:hypothetical protein